MTRTLSGHPIHGPGGISGVRMRSGGSVRSVKAMLADAERRENAKAERWLKRELKTVPGMKKKRNGRKK